jgi:hypothetical protein
VLSWLSNLVSFIPIVGKIVDGVSTYFNKKLDTDLEKYKVDGKIDEVRLQASLTLLGRMQDTPLGRGMHYIFVYPLGIYWIVLLFNQLFKDFIPVKWTIYTVPMLDQWGGWMIMFLFLVSIAQKAR